jgi:hypothetical protein
MGADQEKHYLPFAAVAQPGWFQEPSFSTVLIRLITTVGIDYQRLGRAIRLPVIFSLGRPVLVTFLRTTGGELETRDGLLHGDYVGQQRVTYFKRTVLLPAAAYLVVATPLVVDGYDTGHDAAVARLDQVTGLVGICGGRNAVRTGVYEGSLQADDTWIAHGESIRLPSRLEGPELDPRAWASIIDALNSGVSDENGRKVRLALQYLGQATTGSDAFLLYWTAFEILSGGSQGARRDLAKAYSLKHAQQVDHATGFARIARMRHDLIHAGSAVLLRASEERYIQLLLVDLIRWHLGLESSQMAIEFQRRNAHLLDEVAVPPDWERMFP